MLPLVLLHSIERHDSQAGHLSKVANDMFSYVVAKLVHSRFRTDAVEGKNRD